MNNQRHVSLTITARAPGTPQHQAASVSSEAQRLLDGLFAIAPELTDADENPGSSPAPCIETQPENHMLQIILIGATLSFERPEPSRLASVSGDPLRSHSEHWRTITGVAAFWR